MIDSGVRTPDDPPPRFPSPATRDLARAWLGRWGYHEAGLSEAFGVGSPRELFDGGRSAFLRRTAGPGPLALLARLFVGGLAVPAESVQATLEAAGVAALAGCGLLRIEQDGAARALAALAPFEGLLVAFDRRDLHELRASDYVLGPGPATRRVSDLRLLRPGGQVLDLGCGSGALACLAARDGARVTGIDVNPRALAFARFNAELNGVEVELLQGDLFAPVAGRRFDLVVCNPPYVISPASTFVYRDGGPGLCARIARAAAAHLAEGGVLQMVCHWPLRHGRDGEAELLGWFEGGGCDVWVLKSRAFDVLSYACLWLGQQHGDEPAYARELDEWLAFYEGEGIEAIGDGLVVLRRADGRTPWTEIRQAPLARGPAGESVDAVLQARDLLARTPADEDVLGLRLRLTESVELWERRRPAGSGWERATGDLRLTRGYAFAARLDPVGAALVGFLDGRRSLREAAAAFAAAAGLEVEPLLPGLPDLARRLLRLGLLRLTRGD